MWGVCRTIRIYHIYTEFRVFKNLWTIDWHDTLPSPLPSLCQCIVLMRLIESGLYVCFLTFWTSFFIHYEEDTILVGLRFTLWDLVETPFPWLHMLVSQPLHLSQLPNNECFHRGVWMTRNRDICIATVIVYSNLKCDIRQQQRFLVLKLKYHHPEMKGNPPSARLHDTGGLVIYWAMHLWTLSYSCSQWKPIQQFYKMSQFYMHQHG